MKTQAEKNLLSTSQGLICSKTKKVRTYELKTGIHEMDTGLLFSIISFSIVPGVEYSESKSSVTPFLLCATKWLNENNRKSRRCVKRLVRLKGKGWRMGSYGLLNFFSTSGKLID